MIRTLQVALILGMLLSVLLIFTGYVKAGALTLILTPLLRNTLYGFFSLYRKAYLFAFFAFLTVLMILFT